MSEALVVEGETVLARLIRERLMRPVLVAEALGVSRSKLHRLMHGEARLSLEEAVRASRLFGVPVEAFVEGFGDE